MTEESENMTTSFWHNTSFSRMFKNWQICIFLSFSSDIKFSHSGFLIYIQGVIIYSGVENNRILVGEALCSHRGVDMMKAV